MKKKLLFLSMLISIFAKVRAQNQSSSAIIQFSDPNFKCALINYHLTPIDRNKDGEISREEALKTTRLDLYVSNVINSCGGTITNLEGIQYFTNLRSLVAPNNDITYADLSRNINLENINFRNNSLLNIILGNNTSLEILKLSGNQLTKTDVSKNIGLTYLELNNNTLTAIDVSKNTLINSLYLNNTLITSLDARNCSLKTLRIDNSPNIKRALLTGQPFMTSPFEGDNGKVTFSTVKLDNCPKLEFICVDPIYVAEAERRKQQPNHSDYSVSTNCDIITPICEIINVPDPNFKQALLTHNPVIDTNGDGEISTCEAENTESLNVKNKNISDMTGIEYFINLEGLFASENKLTNLNLSNNTNLGVVSAMQNQLTNIDVSKCLRLSYLYIGNNLLRNIDVTNNRKLKIFWGFRNLLTNVDLTYNTELSRLDLNTNKLTSIDLTNNSALTFLGLSTNKLTAIDLIQNTKIQILHLDSNELTNLNLNNNTELLSIYTEHNKLTNIDVSKCILLSFLRINYNQLENIDISNNEKLSALEIAKNQLKEIDLTNNINLSSLSLGYNNLTSIDITKNSLKNLNISHNYLLTEAFLKGNHLFYNNFTTFSSTTTSPNIIGVNFTNCPLLNLVCVEPVPFISDIEYYVNTTLNYINCVVTDADDCSDNSGNRNIVFKNRYFKNALLNHTPVIDTNNDREISNREAKAVSTLNLMSVRNLTNIDEISFFTNLTAFNSYGNSLRNVTFTNNTRLKNIVISGVHESSSILRKTNSVDLSNNTTLESLILIGNSIENIDLTNKTNLEKIQVSNNNLRSIDVTDCTALVTLEVNDNIRYLDAIDVSNNSLLKRLNISGTKIKNLDLDNNTALTNLNISKTNIDLLDLRNNTALIDLNVSETYIDFLDCTSNPHLKNLDASSCTYLKELNASVNSLSSLNIEDSRIKNLYMKGNHEFYIPENFKNFQLEDAYSLRLVCTDPIANFNDFEKYMKSLRFNGSLNSSTADCKPITKTDLSAYFTIYPNPAKRYLSVNTQNNLDRSIKDKHIYNLIIKDSYGRRIDFIDYSIYQKFDAFSKSIKLSNYNLLPGIYYLTISTEVGQFTSSFVKQ